MDIIAVAIAIGFVLFLLFLLRDPFSTSSNPNLPPGSFGWPLVGETLQFLALLRANRGQEFYEQRIKLYGGDIFKTHILGSPTAVFYSPQGNRFLFSNENTLVHSTWPSSVINLFRNSLISKVGDEAKDVRKLLLNFLKPEALQTFMGRVDSIISDHVKRFWHGETQIEALSLSKRCLYAVACSLFLTMDEGPQQSDLYGHFIDLLSGMFQIPLDLPGTLYRKSRIGSNHIRGILQTVIEKRREDLESGSASPHQDLLSFLLCNVDGRGNGMSDDEIKDNIMLLLMAGHDTSVTTVTMLLRNLALNRDCYQRVLQEQMEIKREKEASQVGLLQWDDLMKMKYTWRAVQETLRLYPPVGGSWRKAIVDISYDGYTIPKGWKLSWVMRSTHRNAEYFEDPEKFDPSRFDGNGPAPYTFLPFGGGPRMCPGNEFARMVILIFIHNIVKTVEWDLVNVNEKVTINPMPIPVDGLPINLHHHVHTVDN
ncbi:hypothetical protein SUGI_0473750 [Cryptomeria japonica]|uniref:cytochrome P450 716B2-like n=1 Tax=Cryptomeria japonica TaxID=3369 RepID=UPI002408B04E|nr:cytochrome P450 716B2-like [Cryptomeria japonica]GLJ24778.1 hypothetical protein SUGI_0473750 [Cryptomeria japonica]